MSDTRSAWERLADAPKGPPMEPETEQEKCQGSHWWQQFCPHCIPKSNTIKEQSA